MWPCIRSLHVFRWISRESVVGEEGGGEWEPGRIGVGTDTEGEWENEL